MSTDYANYLQTAYGERPASYYLQFADPRPVAGQSVLDWGCGLGGLLHALDTTIPGLDLHGGDVIDSTLDSLRTRQPGWDLRRIDPASPTLPWEASSFDRIFLLDVIEHVPNPGSLLVEAFRLLKPGGILTLSTPDRWAFYKRPGGIASNVRFNLRRLLGREWVDPTHLTEYTVGGIRKLLADSPFGASDFRPSPWHLSLWLRPPKDCNLENSP